MQADLLLPCIHMAKGPFSMTESDEHSSIKVFDKFTHTNNVVSDQTVPEGAV